MFCHHRLCSCLPPVDFVHVCIELNFPESNLFYSAREWILSGLRYSPLNPHLLQALGVFEERGGDFASVRLS
jgi:hypothetical protein